jgi:hypothetical protein
MSGSMESWALYPMCFVLLYEVDRAEELPLEQQKVQTAPPNPVALIQWRP